MKPILTMLVVLLLLALFSCGNDDEPEVVLPMFQDYNEFMSFVYSREWMFGMEIDNKDGNTAELYIAHTQVELSMEDEIALTINGEPVGTELLYHEDGVWLDCDSVEIPDNKRFDIVFNYNGDTVFNNTINIPDAPSITEVNISTPDQPINITWQQSSNVSMFDAEVWLEGDTIYVNYLMLSGSARSVTIAANATGLQEINHWGIELHAFNIAQFENNAILAHKSDYEGSQSRFDLRQRDLHDNDGRSLPVPSRAMLKN